MGIPIAKRIPAKRSFSFQTRKKKSENVRRSRTKKTPRRHDGRTPSPTMRQGSSEESDQEETQLQRVMAFDIVPSTGYQEWTHPLEMIICQSYCLNFCRIHL